MSERTAAMSKSTATNRKQERGSALLMTLGILSLLLIMAMAFAFTARTERQVARSNSDLVRARMLANSALERVIAGMKYNFNRDSSGNPAGINFYYAAKGAAGFPLHSRVSAMTDAAEGDSRTALLASKEGWTSDESAFTLGDILTQALANSSDLQNLLNLSDAAVTAELGAARFGVIEAGGELIGRIGYLVIEASGKGDVNQMIFPSVRPPWIKRASVDRIGMDMTGFDNSSSDFFFNLSGAGTWADLGNAPDEGNLTIRLGLHPSEMHLPAEYQTQLPATAAGMRSFWTSHAHLNQGGLSATPNLHLLTFFSGDDEEVYADATEVSAGTAPLTVFHDRFDLSGYSRSLATLPYYTLTGSVYAPDPLNDGWSAPVMTVPVVLTAIPAIAAMRNAANGDISQQVAANLIDYSDADSYATLPAGCDWSLGESADEPPAYCGNEKVPYFNELHLEITGRYAVGAAVDDRVCTLEIAPQIEMFNIFADDLLSGIVRLKLFGTVTVTATFDDSSTQIVSAVLGDPLKNTVGVTFLQYEAASVNVVAKSYAVLTSPSDPVAWSGTFTVPPGRTLDQVNYAVTITKAVLISGEDTADPATIHDIAMWHLATGQSVAVDVLDSVSPTVFNGSLEISDCRSNADLRPAAVAAWLPFSDLAASHTLGDDNTNLLLDDDGSDSDQEEAFFAANQTYSTAYIRNGPMQSLWELGAIHRGEPNMTINLRKFSAAVSTYALGDALILDQVKIGPQRYLRGRMNPNARNPRLVREWSRGIALTDTYDAYAAYNAATALPPPAVANWSADPLPWRGALATLIETAYPATFTSDREAEALLGRSAGLLSTRWEAFAIVTVGQALQELKGIASDTAFDALRDSKLIANPTRMTDGTNTRYCSILATRLHVTQVLRDTWKNEFVVVQTRTLEE